MLGENQRSRHDARFIYICRSTEGLDNPGTRKGSDEFVAPLFVTQFQPGLEHCAIADTFALYYHSKPVTEGEESLVVLRLFLSWVLLCNNFYVLHHGRFLP